MEEVGYEIDNITNNYFYHIKYLYWVSEYYSSDYTIFKVRKFGRLSETLRWKE